MNFWGRPPARPDDAPSLAEVEAVLDDVLRDGEVLVELDCTLYPCTAEVAGADRSIEARLAAHGFPHAIAMGGTVHGTEGDEFVTMPVATVLFVTRAHSPEERRFLSQLQGAVSQRTAARVGQELEARHPTGDP